MNFELVKAEHEKRVASQLASVYALIRKAPHSLFLGGLATQLEKGRELTARQQQALRNFRT